MAEDRDIYSSGKSNLVADALSCCLEVREEIEKEVNSEDDKDKWITVSYQIEDEGGCISSTEFNQAISKLVLGTKIDKKLKDRIHAIDVAKEKLHGSTIKVATRMVSLFNSITPEEMVEHQCQDNQIASKLSCKLALQWNRLILKQGVLHRLYIFNEIEYHQLILPQRHHRKKSLQHYTITWVTKVLIIQWIY